MMTEPIDRFCFQGWCVSLAIHAVAVAGALAFVAQVKPVLDENVFQWDVALVGAPSPESSPQSVQATGDSIQPKVSDAASSQAEIPPEPEQVRVAPKHSVRMVRPRPESVEAGSTSSRKMEPVQHAGEVSQTKVEPPVHEAVAEKMTELVTHAETQTARTQSFVPTERAEVTTAEEEHASQGNSRSLEPKVDETLPLLSQQDSGHAATPQDSRQGAQTAEPSAAPSQSTDGAETPVQVTKAVPSGSESRADHRWLAESLWRRVAELKRYPASARLHGLEGKVVIKAVIRSNGQLAEVSVQKSSGHSVLDSAAMDAVREAFPLEMKQTITRPEIVVSLPLVYSLAN